MDKWLVEQQDYHREDAANNGNRFLCGNGYLGIRGTLEEYDRKLLPAINLAGIYDKVGDGWREPLNAPNPLYTRIKVAGRYYTLPKEKPVCHKQELNYRHGIARRKTVFEADRGKITLEAERFAHMGRKHVIGMQYSVEADHPCELEILTGIDGQVWDINGPHYDALNCNAQEQIIRVQGITHENQDIVEVIEHCVVNVNHAVKYVHQDGKILRKYTMNLEANVPVILEKLAVVYTSKDGENPGELAFRTMDEIMPLGYHRLKEEQILEWEKLWDISEVEIDGDAEAEQALNYSLYHLLSIAPFHAVSQSIPARGLSGQTYKGAIFWDTEMFMLDFFLNTQPKVAKTLLRYRVDTLAGAQEKARQYGFEGAFYAWESQEGGFDACSDYNVTDVFTNRPMRTYFKDKQIHISGAIVYGIMKYIERTGDRELLYEGGAKTVVECARFYDSYLTRKAHSDVYELRDVIGPDEYHERVNNNGYTNRLAQYTFQCAQDLLYLCDVDMCLAEQLAEYLAGSWRERFAEDAEKIYIPPVQADGRVEQFDGYFGLEDATLDQVRGRLLHEKEYWGGAYGVASDTQIIKQADVVTWMVMFPEDFSVEEKWANWSYYEPRTEHGSSLSACMYSILACVCGRQEEAYSFFLKSAQADIKGGGKEWAGNVYIGGTHPAAAGGAYMTAIYGFGGVRIVNGTIEAVPRLPSSWKRLKFRLHYEGRVYEITETKEKTQIRPLKR